MQLAAFLIYDYVITIGQEVELFWTMQLTGASVLFFANRYITLLFNILGLAALAPFSSTQVRAFMSPFCKYTVTHQTPSEVICGIFDTSIYGER